MSSKTRENSSEKEDSKSVPLRRSLRLSSCSPTPSRVLTRSSAPEGSPHPAKLPIKRRLSSELSPKKEKTPITRRSTRSITSIPEEDLPEIEKKTTIKESSQKENVNENHETKRTRNKSSSSEDQTITRVTRSRSNLINEDNPSYKTSKEIKKKALVLLEPIKEVCDGVTTLSLTEEESQTVKDTDVTKPEQCKKDMEKSNKENVCPKEETTEKSSPESQTDDLSCTKSESDSFSITSDAATAISDTLNKSLESNSQSEEPSSLKSSSSNINESEEIKDSRSTEPDDENESNCDSPDMDKLHIDTDEEELKDSSASLQNGQESDDLKSLNKGDIECKIDNLLNEHKFSDDEEEDEEQHPFIDGMAEEGEEDTPSEGSNDIIEIGEEINTTESEYSSDGSYDKDSFIDDEEHGQLLSGDEYDLALSSPKKSRIIQLSSGSDEEIVKINRVKKEKPKKKRKSRIIKISESSEEGFDDIKEIEHVESKDTVENGETVKEIECKQKEDVNVKLADTQENHEIEEKATPCEEHNEVENEKTAPENLEENSVNHKDSIITNEENNKSIENSTHEINKMEKPEATIVDVFLESFKDEIQSEQEVLNASNTVKDIVGNNVVEQESKEIAINSKEEQIVENLDTVVEDVQSGKEVKEYTSSTPNKKYVNETFDESKELEQNEEIDKTKSNVSFNASVSYINQSNTNKNLKKKIVIIENIRVQDIKDKRLSDQINQVIDSWSSGIDNATDVSINLSLNYSDKSANSQELPENQEEQGETVSAVVNEENVLEGKSVGEVTLKKRKKRRNKKPKRVVNLSSEENAEETAKLPEQVIHNKKMKKKRISEDTAHKEGISELLPKKSKKVEIAIKEMENQISKKKRKKRKHSKSEIHPSSVDEKLHDEPIPIKKRKKTWKSTELEEEVKLFNVTDEAVWIGKKNKLTLSTPDLSETSEWQVKKHAVKPSLRPIQDVVSIENKTITCSTSENSKKFHVKDFKNAMLYDPARVRRVDTKQLIKKKMF